MRSYPNFLIARVMRHFNYSIPYEKSGKMERFYFSYRPVMDRQ